MTAASCPAASAEWPWSAWGTNPAAAKTVTNTSIVRLRTAKHSTVTTAATRVLASEACPISLLERKSPRIAPKSASSVMGLV